MRPTFHRRIYAPIRTSNTCKRLREPAAKVESLSPPLRLVPKLPAESEGRGVLIVEVSMSVIEAVNELARLDGESKGNVVDFIIRSVLHL